MLEAFFTARLWDIFAKYELGMCMFLENEVAVVDSSGGEAASSSLDTCRFPH